MDLKNQKEKKKNQIDQNSVKMFMSMIFDTETYWSKIVYQKTN